MFPTFENLNFFSYQIVYGFYSLGFIQHHRPDINLISTNKLSYDSYDKWQKLLNSELQSDKINCLLLNEEDFLNIAQSDSKILDLINSFKKDNLYAISQMDSHSRKIYSHQIPLQVPVIELPWWIVNETLTYHYAKNFLKINDNIESLLSRKFICTIGRNDYHKSYLAEQLIKNFFNEGYVLFQDLPNGFSDSNKSPYLNYTLQDNYQNLYSSVDGMKKNCIETNHDFRISCITKNINGLKRLTKNIPMIIHPESTMGTFLLTEKTTWPLQLGKLQLITAKPYHYQDIQRFVDINFSEIFDLKFDEIEAYTEKQQQEKIQFMLESNMYQIKHSFDLYDLYFRTLQADKTNIAKKYYEFFIQQLNKII